MKTFKYIFCASVCLALTGCATMQRYDHNSDYRKSQTAKPMRTPSGVSSSGIKDYYPVPEVKSRKQWYVSLVPPGAVK